MPSTADTRQLKFRYFASLREKIGRSEETLNVPHAITTGAALADWLAAKGPEYAAAFEHRAVLRVAADQVHVKLEAQLPPTTREIGFFPPVTGG